MRARAMSMSIATAVGVAAMLIGAGTSSVAAQTFPASDTPAGYLVFPKIKTDTHPADPSAPSIETVIQLTNTSANRRFVHCVYVSATDCAAVQNFNLVLAPCGTGGSGPAFHWQVSQNNSTQLIAGVDPFLGELKCIEVNDPNVPLPVNSNDLKGEATIYTFQRANGRVQGVDARTYNAIGFQTTVVSATEPPEAQKFCVSGANAGVACTTDTQCGAGNRCGQGRCVSGTNAGLGCNVDGDCPLGTCAALMCLGATSGPKCPAANCSPCQAANYAACPDVLILNNFFDQAPDPADPNPVPNLKRKITNNLTLVPCSEDLTTVNPEPVTTVQFLTFNEFEQRMSTSSRVQCFSDTPLSNIDAKVGNESGSVFNVGVQGTLADPRVGQGLLAVAEEFRTDPVSGSQASTAVNLNEKGLPPGKGDLVGYDPPIP
jgi:hypothetical protein